MENTNPQLENGYTRVANEILEAAAKLPLSAAQFRILMLIWRYSYGYNKKDCALSVNFIAAATGIDKRHIRREINELVQMNILHIETEATSSSSRVFSFNKHYDTWQAEKPFREDNLTHRVNSPPEGQIAPSTEGNLAPSGEGQSALQKRKIYKEKFKEKVVDVVDQKIQRAVPPSEGEIAPSLDTYLTLEGPTVQQEDVTANAIDDILLPVFDEYAATDSCQDPITKFTETVANCYTNLTGRIPSAIDEVAIMDIAKLTSNYDLVEQIMIDTANRYKPKYPGDRIHSFSYFVPAIKTKLVAEKTKQERRNQYAEYFAVGRADHRADDPYAGIGIRL